MILDETVLKSEEQAVFELRALYRKYGYVRYKMSKFEEYDLYSENKDFLVSDGVITFNDTNGRLLALKPDVTLSILKNFKDEPGAVQRLYYNENVYRISETSHTYREIMQTGLECVGDIGENEVVEVVLLALKSLSLISGDFVLDLSHAGLVEAMIDGCGISGDRRKTVLDAVARKNTGALKTVCNEKETEIYASDKTLLFKYANTKIITNLIGADYPNVKNIVPKTYYYFLEVNANDFLNAINSVAMLTLDRENIVKVTMVEGNVVVSSKSQLSGSGEKILSLFRYTGERLEISFNYHFVVDAIKALGSQDVLLSFVGEMKPSTITDKNDPSNIHLITPVRTY